MQRVLVSPFLCQHLLFFLFSFFFFFFLITYPNRCEVVPHCSFNLYFPNICLSAGDVGQSLDWENPLEKEMDSIHAWRIPWTEEPGGLQSMGSQRVGHD